MNLDDLQPVTCSQGCSGEFSSSVDSASVEQTFLVSAPAPIKVSRRRRCRWPEDAIRLVAQYQDELERRGAMCERTRHELAEKLEEISGNSRDACLRFLRRLGPTEKRSYREWTKPEQQRLVTLIDSVPVTEAARMLRRPVGSVRSMLWRLGLGARQKREWFTPSMLAQALHVSRDEVRSWICRGWLRCRMVEAKSVKIQVIRANDFCKFVKKHGREVIGNRLSYEGLAFVRDYVFPRSHADLLPVRGPYKKEPKGETETREWIKSKLDPVEDDSEQIA